MAITPIDVDVYDGDVSIDAIDAAEQIISNVLSNCDYTEAEKDRIAIWLSAHFQSVIDDSLDVVSEKQGERSYTKGGSYGMNLNASRYGQVAISLDTCGKLANIGKQKAIFDVL